MCNYSEKSCEYKIKVPKDGWVDWDGVNENGDLYMPLPEDCEDEPKTTEEPTPEPTPEPTGPQWGEWGDWKPCSIKCGVGKDAKGVQRRFRTCESESGETCTGKDSEDRECVPQEPAIVEMYAPFLLVIFNKVMMIGVMPRFYRIGLSFFA